MILCTCIKSNVKRNISISKKNQHFVIHLANQFPTVALASSIFASAKLAEKSTSSLVSTSHLFSNTYLIFSILFVQLCTIALRHQSLLLQNWLRRRSSLEFGFYKSPLFQYNFDILNPVSYIILCFVWTGWGFLGDKSRLFSIANWPSSPLCTWNYDQYALANWTSM